MESVSLSPILSDNPSMEENRITIKDIAEELGVSTATVSNVLHGKKGKVSRKTIEKVEAAIERHRYIPSMAALLLGRNDSRIVGVVINDHEKYHDRVLEDGFVSASLNALCRKLEEKGLFMMVKTTRDISEIPKYASMWNMDGLVLIGFCEQDYMYLRNHMRIPFVVYDGYCEETERIFNITIDNYDGGYQVGSYFRAKGHKRAVCIADNDICMDRERYEGFCAGFGKENTEFLIIPMIKTQRWEFYRENLVKFQKATAVFAVSDYYAVDLMHFLQENKIRVPEDVSVAGFDDSPMCEQVTPTLTSVRQDGAMRAKIAIEKLREMKEGRCLYSTIMLPVTLVERASSQRG